MRTTSMATPQLQSSDLPEPGEGRFWRITFNPKSRTNPMTIQLRESYRIGSPVSQVIGFDYAMANAKDLKDKAEQILVRAADYRLMEGDYGLDKPEA